MSETPPRLPSGPAPSPGAGPEPATTLRRALSLPLLVFYGLGTTIGAGIFVLVGKIAGEAGMFAPLSFALASLLMAPSAFAYAEFATRNPFSAGEAVYVHSGFGGRALPMLTGFLVVAAGIVSSATIMRGAAGYFRDLVAVPASFAIVVMTATLGAVALWGIGQSVRVAALVTLLEIGALLVVFVVGAPSLGDLASLVPAATGRFVLDPAAATTGILVGAFLAFYAFIGFEDLANIAEEAIAPHRDLPRAIVATLVITTLLYVSVSLVAVAAVDPEALAKSEAPMSLVFGSGAGFAQKSFSTVILIAVVNGALIQIIMAARVLYGMGRQGWYPEKVTSIMTSVGRHTRTPTAATLIATFLVAALALSFDLSRLATAAAATTLLVFALIDIALFRVKGRGGSPPPGAFLIPRWVPALGAVFSLGFLGLGLFEWLSPG